MIQNDMTQHGGFMGKSRNKWISITIPLGNMDEYLERRGSWEAAALAAGQKLSAWARHQLDIAANHKQQKQAENIETNETKETQDAQP